MEEQDSCGAVCSRIEAAGLRWLSNTAAEDLAPIYLDLNASLTASASSYGDVECVEDKPS